jgi:hypothetical protein
MPTTETHPLESITARLGMDYKAWKEAEGTKNGTKDEFFKAANTAIEPDEKLVVTGDEGRGLSKEDAISLLEKRNPGWVVEDIRVAPPGGAGWEAIMIEDVSLKAFTFVNKADGMVYQRQHVAGSPMLDDELIQAENPELWKKITTVPYEAWIKEVIYHCNSEDVDKEFEAFLEFEGAPERVLRPLNELEPELLAEIQPYIYYSKPSVKLAAPRKAKPEELE